MIWDLFSFIKINKQDFYTMALQCGIYHMDDNMPYAFFSKILWGNEVSNINSFINSKLADVIMGVSNFYDLSFISSHLASIHKKASCRNTF